MPDRAIISLLPAASFGFICGIVAAAMQLTNTGPQIAVGVGGAVLVILTSLSSVLGAGGTKGEKAIVGALRAALAVGIFAGIYLFCLSFLLFGSPVSALVFLLIAGVLGVMLTRLRVRERSEMQASH